MRNWKRVTTDKSYFINVSFAQKFAFSCSLDIRRHVHNYLWEICSNKVTVANVVNQNLELLVRRPMGKLPHLNLSQHLYLYPRYKTSCQPLFYRRLPHQPFPNEYYHTNKYPKYSFNLHSNLRLNFTIINLHIPALFLSESNACFSGSLAFVNIFQDFRLVLYYCGRLTFSSVYSTSKHTSVELHSKPLVFAKAEMTFSILDANHLKSMMFHGQVFHPHPNRLFLFSKSSVYLLTYLIETNPTFTMSVFLGKSCKQKFQLFDGPGPKSREIQPVKQCKSHWIFVTSTFAATVYIFSQNSSGTNVTFTSKIAETMNTSLSTNLSLQYPEIFNCFPQSVCVIKLSTSPGLRFNFTLSNFRYKGEPNTDSCAYAGVWLFDTQDTSTFPLRKIYHGCPQEFHGTSYKFGCYQNVDVPFRERYHYLYGIASTSEVFMDENHTKSVYSEENKAVIVLHSFPEYGNISVHLEICSTSCIVILADLCQSDAFAGSNRHKVPFTHKKTSPENEIMFVSQKLIFDLQQRCVLVQLTASHDSISLEFCKLKIEFVKSKIIDKKMAVTGNGFIQGD